MEKLTIVTYTDTLSVEEVECESHWFASGTVTLHLPDGSKETRDHVVAVGTGVAKA